MKVLEGFKVDLDGKVVLSDSEMVQLEKTFVSTAGGESTNSFCINKSNCDGSANSRCQNQKSCEKATDFSCLKNEEK